MSAGVPIEDRIRNEYRWYWCSVYSGQDEREYILRWFWTCDQERGNGSSESGYENER